MTKIIEFVKWWVLPLVIGAIVGWGCVATNNVIIQSRLDDDEPCPLTCNNWPCDTVGVSLSD